MDTDKLFFWIEALTYLRPDQINMLTHLAEQGEQIEEGRPAKAGTRQTPGPLPQGA